MQGHNWIAKIAFMNIMGIPSLPQEQLRERKWMRGGGGWMILDGWK
jgi:hypothetical protein